MTWWFISGNTVDYLVLVELARASITTTFRINLRHELIFAMREYLMHYESIGALQRNTRALETFALVGAEASVAYVLQLTYQFIQRLITSKETDE